MLLANLCIAILQTRCLIQATLVGETCTRGHVLMRARSFRRSDNRQVAASQQLRWPQQAVCFRVVRESFGNSIAPQDIAENETVP